MLNSFSDSKNIFNDNSLIEKDLFSQRLLENSPIAIYTCDTNGRITFYNQAAVSLWGQEPVISKDKWCGSWKIYSADGIPMILDESPIAKVIKENSAIDNVQIIIETPDRAIKKIIAYPRAIYNSKNELIGAQNTLVDITDKSNIELKQVILSAIVESSSDAIISTNLEGIIISWNKAANKIFGYTENEVLNDSIKKIIPFDRFNEEEIIINSIKSGKKVDHFQTIRLQKGNVDIPISLTVSPLKDKEGNIIGASRIAREITEQLQAQETLIKTSENLQILNSIGKSISEKLDVEVILQRVTDATTKITGASFGAFFYNTKDENGENMMLYSLSGAPRHAFEKLGMPRHTEVFQPTFNGKGIVRVDDITKDPRYGKNHPHKGMPSGHLNVVSYMAIPVISTSGFVIGGLLFGHTKAGVFKEEHEDIVGSIASQAAVALDNSKLFEEVRAFSDKKDEFIALASHELKTPLTSIKGYLQLLERNEQGKVGNIFIKKALHQVEKLNSLVTDLLNVSKIQAGKLELNIEVFDLRELVLDVLEIFHYSDKSHEIVFTDIHLKVCVEADKQRIEQVITNLLNNAIKYSPKATKVYLDLILQDNFISVSIKDKGIGLTEEEQKKIFTRFYRVDGNRNVSGLGLGLYLTKEIIKRHNGEIGVKSVYGEGSDFYFTLPITSK